MSRWTPPIPMWNMGSNRWAYKLYGPLNIVGSFGYRYCRNAQCDSADDAQTAGPNAHGRNVSSTLTPQDLIDTVNEWTWAQTTGSPSLRPAGRLTAAAPAAKRDGKQGNARWTAETATFHGQAPFGETEIRRATLVRGTESPVVIQKDHPTRTLLSCQKTHRIGRFFSPE